MYSISCFIAIVGLFIIMYGVWRISRPKTNRGINNNSANTENQYSKKPNWVWPILIAIALAFWSIVFALFFLAIVWVMRLDPKTDSKEIPFPSDLDRKHAKGTYTWLLVSPILNVIIFAIAVMFLDWNSNTNERVVAALVPLIIHLPVLPKLVSKRPFLFRHTQQAVFLLALRASMAALALNISKYPNEGIWLFILGNGFLWLFGSLWGRSQAHRGTGWWIQRKGEKVLAKDEIPTEKSVSMEQAETPLPDDKLEDILKSLNAEGNNARQIALNAFRKGTPETRKKALLVLSQMGEVEKF